MPSQTAGGNSESAVTTARWLSAKRTPPSRPDYEEFKEAVEKGSRSPGGAAARTCEAKIKEETKATMRCIPLEQPGGGGKCIYCGAAATEKAIFAKAY